LELGRPEQEAGQVCGRKAGARFALHGLAGARAYASGQEAIREGCREGRAGGWRGQAIMQDGLPVLSVRTWLPAE
jgi:hypothetical protein